MKTTRRAAVLLFALSFLSFASSRSRGEPKDEKGKIEALISHVEGLKEASFIRNGKAYDAKSAGKFLRGKWEANRSEIKSAAGFIEKAASVSSTSGQPYRIRFKDGKETKCSDYLRAQLKQIEKAP